MGIGNPLAENEVGANTIESRIPTKRHCLFQLRPVIIASKFDVHCGVHARPDRRIIRLATAQSPGKIITEFPEP